MCMMGELNFFMGMQIKQTSYDTLKMNLHGLPFKILKIQIDNEFVDLKDVKLNGNNNIYVRKDFTLLHIIGE